MHRSLETKNSFTPAVDVASQNTDITFFDNVKAKSKAARRPYGHCFEAVNTLHESFSKDDKHLIYDISDGSDTALPFVMKSSKWKVDLMLKVDKDGDHRLPNEAVFLDVLI